jgi:DNA-binding CsgD family transcriptional regulator
MFALIHGLFWLCTNLAERAPLLLVIDDGHWADRSSLRFLLYLCERVSDLPVAVIVTLRPGEPHTPQDLLAGLAAHPGANVLRLGALTDKALETLVHRRCPAADEEFARACARVSGGNPFYLGELLHELAAEGVPTDATSVGRVERYAPAAVLRATLSRLSRFPPAALSVAQAVAVLGGEAPLRHAAALAQLNDKAATRAADTLAAADIFRPGDPLSYAHPLLQSTVYADIPPAARGLLHARAARLVEGDVPAELAAFHLLHTAGTEDPWAVELLRAAARQALGAGAAEPAVRYLRRALAEPPRAELRSSVLLELGEAEAISGTDAESAIAHVKDAVALLNDPRERAATMLRLGWMLQKAGRLADAAEAFSLGLTALAGTDDDLATLIEVGWLGVAWLNDPRTREVRKRRRALLDRRGSIGPEAERGVLAQEVQFEITAAESHERVIRRATELLAGGALIEDETSDSLNVWVAIGALSWSDAFDLAEEAIEWALEDAKRRGAYLNAAMGYCLRAWPRYWRGRVADAAADAQVAVEASRGGWSIVLPVARCWLALAHIELDDIDAADAALAVPDDEMWWRGTLMHGHFLTVRGRLALGRGQPATALDELLAAGRIIVDTFAFDNPSALPWRSEAALAASQLGDVDRGRSLAAEDLAIARRFGAPRAIGASLRAAGLVEGGARGAELLSEAVAVLETSPSKLELVRALVDLGASLRRSGRRSEARQPLRRGLTMAEHFGAFRLERLAREELAATGAHLGHRKLSGRESLTPSERRVTELAATGMTNREIAQSLFVTVNAVKWHLRNAYAKLEISSREQLRHALEDPVAASRADR